MNRTLQVFILALVVGPIVLSNPAKANGKSCHVCATPSECYLTTESVKKNCVNSTYCLKVWNSHRGVRRACLPNLEKIKADCAFQKISTGGNLRCFNVSEYRGIIHNCYVEKSGAVKPVANNTVQITDTDEKICYCKGDNCNGDDGKHGGVDFPIVKPIEKGKCYSYHCNHCNKHKSKELSCPTPYCRTHHDPTHHSKPKTWKGCGPWSDSVFNISLGIEGSMQKIADCYKGSEFKDGCGPSNLVKECLEKLSPGFGNHSTQESSHYSKDCLCKGNFCHGKGAGGGGEVLCIGNPTLVILFILEIIVSKLLM